MGQGTLSFSKNTQTRILTFDWRSENEHQEPASRLRCGPRRSLRCTCGRCGRGRRAGAGRIRSRLRRIRHELLLHSRHRNLPEGRRLYPLRHRRRRPVRRSRRSYSDDRLDEDGDDTWHKRARFQLRVDARTETELGTLRGYAAINFDWQTGRSGSLLASTAMATASSRQAKSRRAPHSTPATTSSIEHAYVELGGFRIGVTDSYFVTFTGYASGVVNDGLISLRSVHHPPDRLHLRRRQRLLGWCGG